MKKIEAGFNKLIFAEMVFSVVFALVGIIIFLNSDMTNKTAGVVIGTFFLLSGLFSAFTFVDKNKIPLFRFNLVFGILSILLGIFIMFNPLKLIDFLNMFLGLWFAVECVKKFVYFIRLRSINEESRKVIFVSSLVILFLGIVIVINPFKSIVITKSVGIFIILFNILNLSDLVLLKRKANKFLKLFK